MSGFRAYPRFPRNVRRANLRTGRRREGEAPTLLLPRSRENLGIARRMVAICRSSRSKRSSATAANTRGCRAASRRWSRPATVHRASRRTGTLHVRERSRTSRPNRDAGERPPPDVRLPLPLESSGAAARRREGAPRWIARSPGRRDPVPRAAARCPNSSRRSPRPCASG